MPDMLVKLYELPAAAPLIQGLADQGIVVRHAMAYEKHTVVAWVCEHFGEGWASECEVAFIHQPVSCYIATEAGAVVGFACYESTSRNFFGPTGVLEAKRGAGIGKALLLASLHAMAGLGYAYAIIGGVGPADFYAKAAGAVLIDGSVPGIYRDPLQRA